MLQTALVIGGITRVVEVNAQRVGWQPSTRLISPRTVQVLMHVSRALEYRLVNAPAVSVSWIDSLFNM
jgi:hypothetical protein